MVGTVSRLWAGHPRYHGSTGEFSPLKSVQTISEAHPISYSVGYQGLFPPEIKQLKHLVLKLKMSGATPPLPHLLSWHTQTTLHMF